MCNMSMTQQYQNVNLESLRSKVFASLKCAFFYDFTPRTILKPIIKRYHCHSRNVHSYVPILLVLPNR
jgi:hypothetical protein